MKPTISASLQCLFLATLLALPAGAATVGTLGNEPLIAAAPDGTLYISALQYLYRSTDAGKTWAAVTTPIYASTLERASDSSISVDPGGRLYFSFDYPYAGATAVCTTDDRGATWSCNPAVVPGGTDRMWVVAPSNSSSYVVTNEGLYQTVFLTSKDRGLTWTPSAVGSKQLEPQTGPLLQKPGSSLVLQPVKTEDAGLETYIYSPSVATNVVSSVQPTGLPNPYALPNASFATDGTLWIASEELNAAGGMQVVLARSSNEGTSWTKLPPIPQTIGGTAIFSWVAAGSAGHVGVIYYFTPAKVDPNTTTAEWTVAWAETRNANSPSPTWTVRTVESKIHTGPICIALSCSGTNRFAGDFISSIFFRDVAYLAWMVDGAVHATAIAADPVISSLVPSELCQGGTSATVRVMGSNFTAASAIEIDGVNRTTTFVSSTELRTLITAAERANSGPRAVRVLDGASATAVSTLAITPDVIPPVVTPPAPITLFPTACTGEATGAASPALAAFLSGASAMDGCSPASRPGAQVNDVAAFNSTTFPPGRTTVTFRSVDGAGNSGTAISSVTIQLYGDVTLDARIDAQDLVVLTNYLVGNIQPQSPPFPASLASADLNADGAVNAVDLVVQANYLASNIPCLPAH